MEETNTTLLDNILKYGTLTTELEQRLADEIKRLRDVGVPCELFCPQCGYQHVDAPEPENGWTNPPHRKHLCHRCGHVWQPYPVATFGVESSDGKAVREAINREIVPDASLDFLITQLGQGTPLDIAMNKISLIAALKEVQRVRAVAIRKEEPSC